MKYNMTSQGLTTNSFIRRHSILLLLAGPPLFMLTMLITISLGVGLARAIGSNHSPNQITIERTDSAYNDCVTFANARGFAPEVCSDLNANSQIARVNCAYESANNLPRVDCPGIKS
jgi:hypothetical protein